MVLRHISSLLLGLALGLPGGHLAAAEATGDGPWDDVWTMELKDEERTFVDLDGTSYLRLAGDELDDQVFVNGKDVALLAKFAAMDRDRATFYQLDDLRVEGAEEHWARALDGDNVFLVGNVSYDDEGRPVLALEAVVSAPSDAEIVASKLGDLEAGDHAGRLEVAKWARAQSESQGNRAWWLQAATDIIDSTVRGAAEDAAERDDLDLLLRAMDWAITIGGDRDLAAELGSQPWALTSHDPRATRIAERMQTLGYVLHSGKDGKRWMTQAQALTSEYEQRFADMHWRDAEGYYELGRWADQHADVLPHARELSHQAYLKGQQADPRHAGIRRELGLPPVAPDSAQAGYALDFTSADGVAVDAPQGWDRTAKPVASGADVTWIDPRSDTAFMAVTVIDRPGRSDIETVWREQLETVQLRPGFRPGPVEAGTHEQGRLRRMNYQIQAGDEVRPAEMVLIYDSEQGYGVTITVSFVEQEREGVTAALAAAEASIVLPERPAPETEEEGGQASTPGTPADTRQARPADR